MLINTLRCTYCHACLAYTNTCQCDCMHLHVVHTITHAVHTQTLVTHVTAMQTSHHAHCHACHAHRNSCQCDCTCSFASWPDAGTAGPQWCRAGCACGWCALASDAPQQPARRPLPELPAMPASKPLPSRCRSMCAGT